MLQNYVPVFIVVAVVGLFAPLILRLSQLLRPKIPATAVESGAETSTRPERYFAVVVSFVVFAVAMVFLLPWAFSLRVLGVAGLIETLVFLGILAVGYLWIWKKGVVEWL